MHRRHEQHTSDENLLRNRQMLVGDFLLIISQGTRQLLQEQQLIDVNAPTISNVYQIFQYSLIIGLYLNRFKSPYPMTYSSFF